MIKGSFSTGLEILLEQKNQSIEERRRIVATNAALDLIASVVKKDGNEHQLASEMQNLPAYVDVIYESLSKV